MKRFSLGAAATLALFLGFSSVAAQAADAIPFPEAGMARDVPGAVELPDPNLVYKIVFDQTAAPDESGEVSAGLMSVANRYNTLLHYGVPADHIQFVVVIHRAATDTILNNDVYRARNNGADNPDIDMIKKMKRQGIDFRVCGQAVLANEIDPADIMPEVQLNLWAWTTITNLELRGYILQRL